MTVAQATREATSTWCKVLIVEQGEGLWGAQRYLLRLAPLLEERGIEQVLAAPADSATAAAWVADGRKHVVLPSPDDRSVRNAAGRIDPRLAAREGIRMLAVARDIAAIARAEGVNVLHANSHWSHVECAIAAKGSNSSCVLHLHEESELDLIGRLRGLAVLGSAATIAVSKAVRDTLPERAQNHTTVIANGIDADAIQPGPSDPALRAEMSSDPAAPLVLSTSRLDPRKGVQNVIAAVAQLPPELSNTRLAIAGTASLDPAHELLLRDMAEELLPGRVVFLGQRDDIPDLLRSADVLAMGSTLEGMPLGVLEAQAAGTPVVAWPTAGIPEVIEDGRTGLLAREGDVADLAEQICRMISDKPLRDAISANARESVVAEHSLAKQAGEQADLLAEVLKK